MTTADITHDHEDQDAAHGQTPSYDDVNTPVIVLVGVISALLTIIFILFVQGVSYHWRNSYIKSRDVEAVNMPANEAIASQKAILTGESGMVSIDEAMKKVIQEYK